VVQKRQRPAFFGRAAELQQLHSAFETTAATGDGALVMLVGEPGIGKTALCDRLATLVGTADSKGQLTPRIAASVPVLWYSSAIATRRVVFVLPISHSSKPLALMLRDLRAMHWCLISARLSPIWPESCRPCAGDALPRCRLVILRRIAGGCCRPQEISARHCETAALIAGARRPARRGSRHPGHAAVHCA
jgi:hypothetical protein